MTILDNLSSGSLENLLLCLNSKNFTLIRGDCLDPEDVEKAMRDCEIAFHLAANSDVRAGVYNSRVHLEQNLFSTYNILEQIRRQDVPRLAFTSSSTIYGEANTVPTPEDYEPLEPISLWCVKACLRILHLSFFQFLWFLFDDLSSR